jgi:4-amino-4-deoxy-L-arabinose transferase-like glycosyltransferase
MKADRTPNIETTRSASATRPASYAWASLSPALIAVLLGALALLPRLLGLADFITTDEAYHWIARTERFADAVADRRWAETIQTGHPGVTLMWLGSLGLALERFAVGQGWATVGTAVEHLAWLRLPGALLQALLVPAGYLLLRRLVAPATALVAALLWATAPYMIAHARLLHLDALLTSFVTFSLLLLLLATTDDRRPTTDDRLSTTGVAAGGPWSVVRGPWSVVGSGVCAGLALLTKGPALILLPFAGLLLFLLTTDDRRWTTDERAQPPLVSHLLSLVFRRLRVAVPLYLFWLGVALLVVMALWPALWADPARALRTYLDEIVSNGGRPNGDGQFFLGRAVGDPGPLFYIVADLFRMTPVTLIGLLALLFGYFRSGQGLAIQNPKSKIQNRTLLALGAFVLFWTLVMTLGPKKFDRYVLPTWPMIEVLAAAGLTSILDFRLQILDFRSSQSKIQNPKSKILFAFITFGLVANLAWYHPYYLSYYNPLLGGGAAAQRALLIGWGEGMDQVGAWLRAQPDIGYGPVLSALGPTLQPFVPAPVRDVADLGKAPANYAVVYLESIQRAANPLIYAAIRQTAPLQTITIHGIDYAVIYQLPRPFERAVDARWGEALLLRGVTIAREPSRITVTPAWDVRAAPGVDYHVFLHLLDAQGDRVAQVDVAPGGADFPPTSAWQPGRQIAVPLPLDLPPGLPAGEYQLVMGVYEVVSGARSPLIARTAADPALDGPSALLLDTMTLP